MSTDNEFTEQLLADHRKALTEYQRWDEKVKHLLKGRRAKDLAEEDMDAYREAALRRDNAYDLMRHLERALLDDIPGSQTGQFKRIDVEAFLKKDDDE
jgi:hypothetical protein